MMTTLALDAYLLSVVILLGKFVTTALIQARIRLGTKTFQYEEDARCWQGVTAEQEDPRVVRAQRLLRNDGEGQPYFLALGGLYVATGTTPSIAPIYFGVYALSRVAHAYWFFRPTQPARNIAFSIGLTSLVIMGVHMLVVAGLRGLS